MIKAIGNYLLSGRFKSVAMISLLTILSLLFPPLSYVVAGTPLGLVTLRKGARYGLHILLGTLLLTSIFGYFSRIGFGLGFAFATSVWLPVWLNSLVLRMTESHTLSMLFAGGIGILFVLVLTNFNEEITLWWQSWVDIIRENNLAGAENVQVQEFFDGVFPLLNGIIAGGFVLSLITTMLLARAWQSSLFNPGGFREEFHRLLLPRTLILVTLICLALRFLDMGNFSWLAGNILVVLVVLHVFQGIATVHRIVFTRQLSKYWLVSMYSFLLIMPQMALFLVCIGLADILNRGKKTTPNDSR